jgi:hypothetical protein
MLDPTVRQAEEGEQLGRLIVLKHPEIAEPAPLEVFPDQVGGRQSTERLVRLGVLPTRGPAAPSR